MGILRKSLLITIILLGLVSHGLAVTPKVIPSTDITYLGAFRLPSAPSGYSWNTGTSGGDWDVGLEYLPTDSPPHLLVLPQRSGYNSLPKDVLKVTIPTLVTYPNSLSLSNYLSGNTSSVVGSPVDITAGHQGTTGQQSLGDVHYLPAKGSQARAHLYWSIASAYSSDNLYNATNGQFGWAETDLSGSIGEWRIGNSTYAPEQCITDAGQHHKCSTFVGKYIFHAPDGIFDGTSAAGKTLLVGYKRSGGGMSSGPTIYAIAPWGVYQPENIAGDDGASPPPDARDGAAYTNNETTIPNHYFEYVTLLRYGTPPSASGVIPSHQVTDAAFNTSVTSARWLILGSKRAIVFSGNQQYRTFANYEYNYGSEWYPTHYEASGYHAYPVSPVLWFYDVDDIIAVAAGTKQPYEPQPYARMDLGPYMVTTPGLRSNTNSICGLAYNETNNIIYVQQSIVNSSGTTLPPIIHVFQLTDIGSSLDTTPPNSFTITQGTTTHTSVTFSWNVVSDNSGRLVSYLIYEEMGLQYYRTTAYLYLYR